MSEQDGELQEALMSLGLSRKEASVLSYLLLRGSATAKEIMAELSIHQPQLYDVISSLERKGFLYVQQSKPKVYIAERPSVILERLEREYTKKKSSIISAIVKSSTNELARRNLIWVTRGLDNVVNNSISLIQEAKNELYIEAPPHILRKLVKSIKVACSKGVKTYVLLYPSLEQDLLSELVSAGIVELKTNALGQFYLVVPDAEQSVLMPRMMSLEEGNNAYGYVFKDKLMSLFFIHYFFDAWKSSETAFRKLLRESDYPMSFYSQRFAVWEILKAQEAGLKPKVTVSGYTLKQKTQITLSGFPFNERVTSDVINFELQDLASGKRYLIGGDNAILEDISAEKIVIELA